MGTEIIRNGDSMVDVTEGDMPEGLICEVTAWPHRDEWIGKPIHRCHLNGADAVIVLGQGEGHTTKFDNLPPGVRARILVPRDILRVT